MMFSCTESYRVSQNNHTTSRVQVNPAYRSMQARGRPWSLAKRGAPYSAPERITSVSSPMSSSNFFREIKNSASIFVKDFSRSRRNEFFPDRILWTDEATFIPNSVFNTRNFLFWAEENPHVIRERAFQYRCDNVWTGVTANRMIGPYFIPPRLNGEIYRNFLQNELPALLKDIPLH